MKRNGWIAAADTVLAHAARVLQHPSRKVTAVVAALLLSGGGAAFAVASFGPDAAALPVRQVLEAVTPLPVSEQVDALQAHTFELYRSEVVRPTDTIDSLLARLGVTDSAAAAFLRQDTAVRTQLLGRYGRTVRAEVTESQGLKRLTARWVADDSGHFRRLVVERDGGSFTSRYETAPLVPSARMGSGTIRSSLFAAVDDARIPDEVAVQLADIFGGEIDFQRGLRKGDRFSVVYEALEADGEPLRTGRVLSVEFVNNGKTHQAIWFQEPGAGKGGYFNGEGKSLTSSYLPTPMEFSRITSGFANRFHPILKQWRAHLGVDYGAPTGAPVRTVGDGVVEFAGWQNGFGNVVFVRHNPTDQTVYAHLSRIDVRPGQQLKQGQRIGAVGATGWATGPHLHFEFRVRGAHHDPVEIARRTQGTTLTAAARPAFEKLARSMRMQLDAAAQTVASIE